MDRIFYSYLIICFFCTLIILNLFVKNFQKYFLDLPNNRSSHILPTATSGGTSFVLTSIFFSSLLGNFIPLVSLPLAITGIIDDKFGLRLNIRYGVHLLTSILILIVANKFNLSNLEASTYTIFYIFMGTSIINMINFLDGIDGLVSLSMIIYFMFLSILYSNVYLIFISSLIPFLIYNWAPAKIFMGDIGSTFLGAIAFGSIVQRENFADICCLLIILSPLLLDASISIFRRLLIKENIFSSHKLHLYQRLYQAGFTHGKVSLIYSSAIFVLGIVSLFKNLNLLISAATLVIFSGIFLEKKYAVPFPKPLSRQK